MTTTTSPVAQLLSYLDQAAVQSSIAAQRCAGQGQWAQTVRWGALNGRITSLMADLIDGSDVPVEDRGDTPPRSTYQLLLKAEECTHDLSPNQSVAIPRGLIIDVLDLVREAGSLA